MRSFARASLAAVLLWAGGGLATTVQAQDGPPAFTELGFGIFQNNCTACHGNPNVPAAPQPTQLRQMTPEHIYDVLTHGVMKPIADGLGLPDVQRRLVAESLAGRLIGTTQAGDAAQMKNKCSADMTLQDPKSGPSWNGFGNGSTNQRFQPTDAAGLTADSVNKLDVDWAFGFPGGVSAYGQPAVVGGRVYVGTDTGFVYSIDAKSGCVHWSFQAQASMRNPMTVGPIEAKGSSGQAVYFGDLKGTVYAVDAQTGKQIWATNSGEHYSNRVTAAPALFNGKLFVPYSSWEEFAAKTPDYPCCQSVGLVAALDANTGGPLWKSHAIAGPPKQIGTNSQGTPLFGPAGGSIWNTPTIDAKRNVVYFGTGDATTYPAAATSDAIMAVDMDTGSLKWSHQMHAKDSFLVGCSGDDVTENCPEVQGPDWDIPAPAMLVSLKDGRDIVVAATKPGDVAALDPETGKELWRINLTSDTLAGDGPLPEGRAFTGVQWGGGTDGDSAYFGLSGGGVVAISLTDGKRKWLNPLTSGGDSKVGHNAPVAVTPDVVYAGGTDGMLYALSTKDGKQLWSYNTAKDFSTVNGVAAHGGTFNSQGPVVAGGQLFVSSGYLVIPALAGNVLIAFSPDAGKSADVAAAN